MTTAIITATYHINMDSPLWPVEMTDQEKLTGWIFAARIEPEVAFMYLVPDDIDGRIEDIEGRME